MVFENNNFKLNILQVMSNHSNKIGFISLLSLYAQTLSLQIMSIIKKNLVHITFKGLS